MLREHWGRGGLPAEIIDHALRLFALEQRTGERLSDRVIAERVGCSVLSVWRLRRGVHPSQRDDDRRGGRPERVRIAQELLARGWSRNRVARMLGMGRNQVTLIDRGEYITQRRR